MDLSGTSALVTGGAAGLGASTARALRNAGAAVVVADLPAKCEEMAQQEPEFIYVPTDVTDESQVLAAVRAASDVGQLRIAVACAGIVDQHRLLGSWGPLSIDNVRRVIDVNFVGSVALLANSADAMQDNTIVGGERGVVILVSSIAGLDGASIAYGGSKAAVAGITLAAARELSSRKIRVVTIAPGLFETGLSAGMSEGAKAVLEPPHPARAGRPDEFASLVCHIVENQMMNGEVIRLDGAARVGSPPPRRNSQNS